MSRKTLPSGTAIGRYQLSDVCHEDTFGVIYCATGPCDAHVLVREFFPASLSTRRAVKVYPPRKSGKKAFEAARADCVDLFDRYLGLKTQGLVPGLERIEANGTQYLVTSNPTGEPLADIHAREGNFSPARLRICLRGIFPALKAFSAAGFVHAGLSPQTMRLAEDEQSEISPPLVFRRSGDVVLLSADADDITAYSAPELFTEGGINPKADIYSLAAIGCFLLTGNAPPPASQRLAAVSAGQPDPLDWEEITKAVGKDVRLLSGLKAAMRTDAATRCASFAEFDALITIPLIDDTGAAVAAADPVFAERTSNWPLFWTVFGLVASIVLGLIVFLPGSGFFSEPAPVITAENTEIPNSVVEDISSDGSSGGSSDSVDPILPAPPVEALSSPDADAEVSEPEENGSDLAEQPVLKIEPEPDTIEPITEPLPAIAPAPVSEPEPEPQIRPEPVPTTQAIAQAADFGKQASFRDCETCPTLVSIPAGGFLMGAAASEPGQNSAERPQHRVSISSGFAMMTHEVTLGEYQTYLAETGVKPPTGCVVQEDGKPGYWSYRKDAGLLVPGFAQTPEHPASCVSWHDANAYADWLSAKTGKRYRLPTEAEWEYAARSGASSAYSWGASSDQACANANGADASLTSALGAGWIANACADAAVFTSPVGQYAANGSGLSDMSGNVWEWVSDCPDKDYSAAPETGVPVIKDTCPVRGLRGGSWASSVDQLRSAKRHTAPPSNRYNTVGFRLVREQG